MSEGATTPSFDLQACARLEVLWRPSVNPERPYRANCGSDQWEIRLNDFPSEPMFTLFIDGSKVGDFDD